MCHAAAQRIRAEAVPNRVDGLFKPPWPPQLTIKQARLREYHERRLRNTTIPNRLLAFGDFLEGASQVHRHRT